MAQGDGERIQVVTGDHGPQAGHSQHELRVGVVDDMVEVRLLPFRPRGVAHVLNPPALQPSDSKSGLERRTQQCRPNTGNSLERYQ